MTMTGPVFNGGSTNSWKPPYPAKPGLETALFKYITPIPEAGQRR